MLLYASLTLDALSVAFQDRTPSATMTEHMINVATLMAAAMILLLFYSGLARGAPAQELAALGAGSGTGAVAGLAGAGDSARAACNSTARSTPSPAR